MLRQHEINLFVIVRIEMNYLIGRINLRIPQGFWKGFAKSIRNEPAFLQAIFSGVLLAEASRLRQLGQQAYSYLFLFQPTVVQRADKLPRLIAGHSDEGAVLLEFDQADLVGR